MKKIFNIRDYKFSAEDRLFFDTNIWFYLIGPRDNPDKQAQVYFRALEDILQSKSIVYIDTIIISELINRYAKYLAKQLYNIETRQYEKFRESKKFNAVTQAVGKALNGIMDISQLVSNSFEKAEINSIISSYSRSGKGFNDQILEQICLANNLMLVTNDIDFKNSKCHILTANYNLLI